MKLVPLGIIDAADVAAACAMGREVAQRWSCVATPRVALVLCVAPSPSPTLAAEAIARLHARLDIVPMRWGESLRTTDEAEELLRRQEHALTRSLDAIRDRTEFGVRLLVEAKPARVAAAVLAPIGRSYLAARARHYAAEDGIPTGLTPHVAAWIGRLAVPDLAARLEGPSPGQRWPSIAILVPRAHADHLVRRVRDTLPELGVPGVLSGPWAPFSFVNAIDIGG